MTTEEQPLQLGELRPGDLLSTAYHETALIERLDRHQGLVRLHLTTVGGDRSWSTAWMPETGRIQGTVHWL